MSSEPPRPTTSDEIRWALVTRGWPLVLMVAYAIRVVVEQGAFEVLFLLCTLLAALQAVLPRWVPLRLLATGAALSVSWAIFLIQALTDQVSILSVSTVLFALCHLALTMATHWLVVSPPWVLERLEPTRRRDTG